LWLCAVIAASFGLTVVRAQDVPAERSVKAAFLTRFPQFVEWPSAAWDGRRTVDVCVLRPSPFGVVLRQLAEGATLGDRAIVTREVTAASLDGCHLLFVTPGIPDWAAALRRAKSLPILTVSDAPDFLDEGGVLQLRTIGTRVRFDIDIDAADRVGLRINPQLLRLAADVRGRSK
jgi:hypothetical protein